MWQIVYLSRDFCICELMLMFYYVYPDAEFFYYSKVDREDYICMN